MTFPLNRMVGREFVPDEDMGEWTIHMDAPEGTSLEGSQEMAFKLLKEVQGIEGVARHRADRQSGGSGVIGGGGGSNVTHIHFLVQALPLEERKETPGADDRRDAQAAGDASRRTGRASPSRNALGSGEGAGGFAISANILGPDLDAAVRLLAAGAGGGAADCRAWPSPSLV